jgi:hypothetical protein
MAALVTLALLLRRAGRVEDWITSAAWATLAVVVSLPWEMLWYVLSVLPFMALGRAPAAGGGRPLGLPARRPRADHPMAAHPRLPPRPQ